MNNPEAETFSSTMTLVAPNGLGFGEGGINVKAQVEKGILTTEAPRHIHELLMNDNAAFKAVEVADDGCGDGRPWQKIVQMVQQDGESKIRFYHSSKLRAKVFGGGLVVAASMWRTLNGAPAADMTVGKDRAYVAGQLAERGFDHGAHSDDHATGDKCGCGAIDNYPVVTANALKYRQQITGALGALYGDTFQENQQAIEATFAVYDSIVAHDSYFADADGKTSMDQIMQSGAIVKELAGGHVEETIVINDVEGTTLDQLYFTQTVKNACVEEQKPQTIQAFSVDTWRGKRIAAEVAAIASEQGLEYDDAYKLAYADFLIRTLAVAGTLTSGDLPVYVRQ